MACMERVEVAVVGAGLVGAAVAYDLAAAGVRAVVLEGAAELAAGASRSNSGIVHTGFDSTPGTLETAMIRDQARRWRAIFDALGVPYRVPGALVIATDDEQVSRLPGLAEQARGNGVTVELLDRAAALEREPHAAAHAALLVPGEAMTDPYEVVRRLLAVGPPPRLGWPVARVEPDGDAAVVSGPAGRISARFVVNCAGLHADELVGDDGFRIVPRRGEFVVYERSAAGLARHILLPLPTERTKGVLVFPTIYNYLCAGPSAVDQEAKDDWRPHQDELARVREQAAALVPALRALRPVDAWAGLRPAGHPRGYVVEWSRHVPALLHVAGIRSTGLSACLGLSRYVLDLLDARGLERRAIPAEQAPAAPPTFDDPPRPWWRRLNELRGVHAPWGDAG